MTTTADRIKALLDSENEDGQAARVEYREALREARAAVQADAEGFEKVVFAIERVGRYLCPQADSLGKTESALAKLVRESVGADAGERFERKLFLLRNSRNDFMHQGAYARNAAAEAVSVALDLEDALSIGWKSLRLRDVMVSKPVFVEGRHTLRDVRHHMLESAFTCIPARVNKRWFLLTDRWLAGRVNRLNREDRDTEWSRFVSEVLPAADVPEAKVFKETDPLADLEASAFEHGLLLVERADGTNDIIGVVAPSDIL